MTETLQPPTESKTNQSGIPPSDPPPLLHLSNSAPTNMSQILSNPTNNDSVPPSTQQIPQSQAIKRPSLQIETTFPEEGLSPVFESQPHLEASPFIKPQQFPKTFQSLRLEASHQQQQTRTLKRTSNSLNYGESSRNVEVKPRHVFIKEQPDPSKEETQPFQQDGEESLSSRSSYGDEPQLNRQIQEKELEEYDRKNAYFFKTLQENESNESGEDEREIKMRQQEVVRLAAESKARIEQQLQKSEQLKRQMESERSFGRKILSSFVASAVVGTATILLTKNKRNSVLASLATLACSFIIQ